jgi:hypothetical protein
MMFNQSNDLPFDPVNLQVQPINFSLQNPPYVPNNVNTHEALYDYVPAICALLANEIQTKATASNTNFLRVFMYNQCAPNNFATEAFDQLVHATLDFVVYILTPPVSIQNPSVEAAIEYAVPEMVYMMAAYNCQQYPRLGSEVPQQLVGTLKALIEQYHFVSKEIENLKRGGQKSNNASMGNRSAFGGRGSFGGGQANNNNRGSFGGGGQQQQSSFGGFGNRNNNQNANTNRSFGASSGLFSNTSSTPMGFGKQTNSFGGGASQPATQIETKQTTGSKYPQPNFSKGTNMQPAAQAPQQSLAEELSFESPAGPSNEDYTATDWVPSKRYPYFPAFNPATMTLSYEIQADGTTHPILKKRDPNMEYDRHALPSVFGNAPESYDLSRTAQSLQRIQKGTLAINSEAALAAAPVEEGQEEPKTVLNHPEWFIETSLTGAWLVTQLARLELDQSPDVFRANAMVTSPIIVTPAEKETVSILSKCMTYKGLREQMEAAYTRMTPELYQALNTRITRIVNQSIRLEMGIPKLSMTDFRTDIVEVLEYMEERYGKDVLNAFTSRQEAHIKEAMATLDDEASAKMVDSFLAGKKFPNDIAPTMLCLATNFSLTVVNVRSFDLELELGNDGLGSAVTPEAVPEIHELVKGLFSAPHAEMVHRHLIRTQDGRVMEAAQGALGDGYYTLSLVE